MGSYMESVFDDFNTFTGAVSDNDQRTYLVGVAFSQKKIKTGFNYMSSVNNQSLGLVTIQNISGRVTYIIGEKKWNISTSVAYSNIEMFDFTPDKQWLVRPEVKWTPTKEISLALAGRLRFLKYGDRKSNAFLNEQIIQLNLFQTI